MGKKYYAAQQPDYGDQIFNALSAQLDVFPRAMEAEKKYRPQMAQLEMDIHRQMAPQIMGMMEQYQPRLAAMDRQTLAAQREADIGAIESLGPRAMSAMRSVDPAKTQLMDTLTEQAQEGLAAGGQLTDMQRRNYTQNVRGAQASRGVGMGPSDAAYEAAELQLAGERRQQQRNQDAYRAIGMRQGLFGDQFAQVLGKPSGVSPMMAMQAAGQGRGYSPGQLFNPESPMAHSITAANTQALNMQRANNAQASNMLLGAGLGALGSIGGGWAATWG